MINIKENAKIMAELLRSGHTMLNLACPECNNPLFRNLNKEIFCPICNKKVLVKKEKNLQKHTSLIEKDNIINIGVPENKSEFDLDFKSIKKILKNKINWISQKLENETQLDLIERYINILIKLFDFLNKIVDNSASAGI